MIQIAEENKVGYDEEFIRQTEEEDFKRCSAINDEWNAEITKQRVVRLAEEKQAKREKILQYLLLNEEKQVNERQRIDEQIRKAKIEALTFITAENIDASIEECLANIVDHNRAVDLQGNWYEGMYPPIPDPKEPKESMAAEQQT